MLIFAILALIASADGYRTVPDYWVTPQPTGNNVLRMMCERNGVNYDNVENSAIQLVNCVQLKVDVTTFEREFKQAESDDQYKKIFQKFCAKSPQLKNCYHKFLDVVIPCAGGKNYNNVTAITKIVTDQILDYVCFNGGEPITTFVVNRGPQCFASKQYDILMCAEYYKNTAMYMQQSMNISTALDLNDSLLKCITEKLETCDNPTTSIFFRNISNIARDGFTQILEFAANDMDTITGPPTPPVEYNENSTESRLVVTPNDNFDFDIASPTSPPSPVYHRRPSPMISSSQIRNMFMRRCEQNGVNYNNVENSFHQFVYCLHRNFEINMFERELSQVRYTYQYKGIFEKYCAKSPQLKTCYHNFFDDVIPCADGEKYNATSITKHVTDQILDNVCFNGGEPLTTFMTNHIYECFSSKEYEIMMCTENYNQKVMYIMGQNMNLPEALISSDLLLKCIAGELETCHNHMASEFFGNVSEVVRNGFMQILEEATKYERARSEKYKSSTQPWSETPSMVVTPRPNGDPFELMCEQNGVDYHTIRVANRNFSEYLQDNFDLNILTKAQDYSSYSKIFKEHCAKSPQLRSNYHKLTDVVNSCFGANGHNFSIISKNVNDQLLDYLCYNNGYRITKFFTEGGTDCVKSKESGIDQCLEAAMYPAWILMIMDTPTVNEIIARYESFLNCILQKIKSCDRQIAPEMLKSIIDIVHKTTSQGAVKPISNVTIPVNRNKPEESLSTKVSKMCEANGENYRIITTIGDEARICLEEHLNITISYNVLANAEYNDFFTTFFQRYCIKKSDPGLRSCIRTFTYGVSPCFGNEAQHYLASTAKAYDKILDYVCETGNHDRFESISKFFADRGLKCLENNTHEILRCTENEDVLDCILKKLDACDSYKMFEGIGSIIRTSSLNQIKQINSYAAGSIATVGKERHYKSSGNLILSFNADIVV